MAGNRDRFALDDVPVLAEVPGKLDGWDFAHEWPLKMRILRNFQILSMDENWGGSASGAAIFDPKRTDTLFHPGPKGPNRAGRAPNPRVLRRILECLDVSIWL
jgi:hypothetical protein